MKNLTPSQWLGAALICFSAVLWVAVWYTLFASKWVRRWRWKRFVRKSLRKNAKTMKYQRDYFRRRGVKL